MQKIINNIFLAAVLTIFMMAAHAAGAQPGWAVTPSEYQYTMSVTGVGLFHCQESFDEGDMVAAFVGDSCRGVQEFGTLYNDRQYAFLTVFANVPAGEQITFKLYDSSEDEEMDVVYQMAFEENGIHGSLETPYLFKTDYELVDLTMSNSTLYDYNKKGNILGEVLTVNENGDTSSFMIDFVDDSLGLDNDYFSVDGSTLILEEDVDYKNKKTYQIHLMAISDAGCEVERDFLIEVINTNVPPTGLDREVVEVDENEPLNTVVTELIALDETPDDEHKFTLVGDTIDWPDNALFEARQDQLLNRAVFDYEKEDYYVIQIEIEDRVGNTVIDTLEVRILDVIEFDDLKASNLITPNEDGFNDAFEIPNVYLFADYSLFIFNDLGNKVYSVDRNYDNSWDGISSKRKKLPSGTYYYLLRDNQVPANQFTGEIHLYRNSKF